MCDTIAVVRPGEVLLAKNSDRDANEAQLLEWTPRREHAPEARQRCTWLTIDQAPVTWATLVSRPFWMWGAEMGTNEHGVTIGNEAVFTKAPVPEVGLTGMDLLRLALERARTADEAVEVIVSLAARYGQGGGCGHEKRSFRYHSSFIVADPRGALVLETAGDDHAVERVTSGARSISNGLTIDGFAGRWAEPIRTRLSRCSVRRRRTEDLAGAASSPADLAAILRDHGPGGLRFRALDGGLGQPCMHAGGLAINSQTTASWVARLTPDGCQHWATGTAAPCTGLFKPVCVDVPVATGGEATDRADDRSLWWRHERLHRVALRDLARAEPLFRPERDAFERLWFEDPPPSVQAFDEGDRLLARWTADVTEAGLKDRRPLWARRFWAARDRRAKLRLG